MSGGYLAAAAIITAGTIYASHEQSQAAKDAAREQKQGLGEASQIQLEQLEEQRRQYDEQMEEYRRKKAEVEKQFTELKTSLAPYKQGGQGAFFEMLALSGIAVPSPVQTEPVKPKGIEEYNVYGGGIVKFQRNIDLDKVASKLRKPVARDSSIEAMIAGSIGDTIRKYHPEWSEDQIQDASAKSIDEMKQQRELGRIEGESTAISPYAGMTGEQAQEAAIAKISDSPILQELTRQGEEAILQRASATGGLRGGNVQGALSQYRPAMLQQAINEQYARLAGLSNTGMSATTTAAYPPDVGGHPGILPLDPTLGNLAIQSGNIDAAQILAEAQARANMIGGISSGVGYGMGAYLNRPQTPQTPQIQGGSTRQYYIGPGGRPVYEGI